MKASAKLRDGQEPLLRVKIPLDIFGMRLCSGVSVGSRQELGLHLSTSLAAGPSCRVTFLPNDSLTPLSVMLKAGVGPWGSPTGSCLAISAQLTLPSSWSRQQRPSFSISLKPRNGDFMLLKSLRGLELPLPRAAKAGGTGDDHCNDGQDARSVSVAELAKAFDKPKSPRNGVEDDWVLPDAGTTNCTAPTYFFKGWNVAAHTSLPLGQRVSAGLRWRMEVPSDLVDSLAASPHKALSRLSLPVLKLDKISIHGRDERPKLGNAASGMREQAWMEDSEELNKVSVMCASIRRQLHLVYSENRVLRNTMEEMRTNFSSRSIPSLADYKSPPSPASLDKKEEVSPNQNQHKPRLAETPAAVSPERSPPPPATAIAKELKKAIGGANKSAIGGANKSM